MKQISFNFTNNKILFDLVDAPVADAWWQQMQLKQTREPLTPSIRMEPDFPRFSDVEECNRRILQNIKQMEQYNFYMDWPEDINAVSQENLNALHQQFHAKEELYKDQLPQSAHDTLQQINQCVHQIEQSRADDPVNYTVLEFGTLETEMSIARDIELEERTWFQEAYYEQQNPVSLLLGYCTLGKHLGHCVWTDDVQVVVDGMLRPQKHIYTQVLFRHEPNFQPRTPEDVQRHNLLQHQHQARWILENKLESHVSADDPVHCYNTAPVVAYVNAQHAELTEQDWFNIWTKQTLQTVDLQD